MSVLLDSHVWIWWLTGQKDLPARKRQLLDRLAQEGAPPFLAAISLWEAQMLYRKGRLRLEMDFPLWLSQASDPSVVHVLPLDTSVVLALDKLPERFHGDPADRIIVATAKAHGLELVTEDRSIRKSRVVKVL
ncbi:MAG: type II toxin-antitoxin system VapC family toxin [Chthoniobacterales bacterium]|nr:type II toxin-antitoxin system VapC family toxin [Chthoniobacterales bacterium]